MLRLPLNKETKIQEQMDIFRSPDKASVLNEVEGSNNRIKYLKIMHFEHSKLIIALSSRLQKLVLPCKLKTKLWFTTAHGRNQIQWKS